MDGCIMIYSTLSILSFRQKHFTPMHIYLYLTSEIALLTYSFMVVKFDVGVMNSPR